MLPLAAVGWDVEDVLADDNNGNAAEIEEVHPADAPPEKLLVP